MQASYSGFVSAQDGETMMDGPTGPSDFPNLDEPGSGEEAETDKAGPKTPT